jgi:hypothetical protein
VRMVLLAQCKGRTKIECEVWQNRLMKVRVFEDKYKSPGTQTRTHPSRGRTHKPVFRVLSGFTERVSLGFFSLSSYI